MPMCGQDFSGSILFVFFRDLKSLFFPVKNVTNQAASLLSPADLHFVIWLFTNLNNIGKDYHFDGPIFI